MQGCSTRHRQTHMHARTRTHMHARTHMRAHTYTHAWLPTSCWTWLLVNITLQRNKKSVQLRHLTYVERQQRHSSICGDWYYLHSNIHVRVLELWTNLVGYHSRSIHQSWATQKKMATNHSICKHFSQFGFAKQTAPVCVVVDVNLSTAAACLWSGGRGSRSAWAWRSSGRSGTTCGASGHLHNKWQKKKMNIAKIMERYAVNKLIETATGVSNQIAYAVWCRTN